MTNNPHQAIPVIPHNPRPAPLATKVSTPNALRLRPVLIDWNRTRPAAVIDKPRIAA
jgi:hypothetical protein